MRLLCRQAGRAGEGVGGSGVLREGVCCRVRVCVAGLPDAGKFRRCGHIVHSPLEGLERSRRWLLGRVFMGLVKHA